MFTVLLSHSENNKLERGHGQYHGVSGLLIVDARCEVKCIDVKAGI